jgi:hypothetical protein
MPVPINRVRRRVPRLILSGAYDGEVFVLECPALMA